MKVQGQVKLLGVDLQRLRSITQDLVHEVRQKIKYRSNAQQTFHFVYRHELGTRGYVTRMSAHAPERFLTEVSSWVQDKFLTTRRLSNAQRGLTVAHLSACERDRATAFHWRCFRAQARGIDPNLMARDQYGELQPLADLLRIGKKMREPTVFDATFQLFGRSESLGPTAIRKAEEDNFRLLSALNDSAWRHLYVGWELDEYRSRRIEQSRRENSERRILERFGEGTDLARQRIKGAVLSAREEYSTDPHARQRTWRGWWI